MSNIKTRLIFFSVLLCILLMSIIRPINVLACSYVHVSDPPCSDDNVDKSKPKNEDDDDCETCKESSCDNEPSDGVAKCALKAPVTILTRDGRFRINDVPLWYDATKGPRFYMTMRYEPAARRKVYNNAPAGFNWSMSYLDYGFEMSYDNANFFYGNGKTFSFKKEEGKWNSKANLGDRFTGILGKVKTGRNLWISENAQKVIVTDEKQFHYYFEEYVENEYRLIWIADKMGDKLKFYYIADNNTRFPNYAITADNRRFNFTYWSELTGDESPINGKLKEVTGPLKVLDDNSFESVEGITGTMKLFYIVKNDSYAGGQFKNFVLLKTIEDMGGRSFTYEYIHTNLSYSGYPNKAFVISQISEENGPVTSVNWSNNPFQITLTHPNNSWETVRFEGTGSPITACYWNSQKGSSSKPLKKTISIVNSFWQKDESQGDHDLLGRTKKIDRLDINGIGGLNYEYKELRPFLSQKIYREVIYKGQPGNGEILSVTDYQYYKDASQLTLKQKQLTDVYQKFGYIYKEIKQDKDGNIIKVTCYDNLKVNPATGKVLNVDTIVKSGDGTLLSESIGVVGSTQQWSDINKQDVPTDFPLTYYQVGSTSKNALNNALTKWREYRSLYNDKGQEYATGVINGDITTPLKVQSFTKYYETGLSAGKIKEYYTPAKLPIKLVNGQLLSTAGLKKTAYEYDFGGNTILEKHSYIDSDGNENVYETIKNSFNIFHDKIKAQSTSDNKYELWSYACCGLASYTDGEGNVMLYERDQRKRIIREIRMTKTGRRFMDTRYTLDFSGNKIKVKTMSGAVTKVNYDDADRLVSATDELGRTIRYGYDLYNNQIYTINPDGTVKRNFYDNKQRLIHTAMYANATDAKIDNVNIALNATTPLKSSDNQPLITSMTYYANNMVKAQYGPYKHDASTLDFTENNFSSKSEYELDGRLIKQYTATAKGVVYTRNEYDNDGKVLKVIGPVLVGSTESVKDISQENIYSETGYTLYSLTAPYTANNNVAELVRNVTSYKYDYRFGSAKEVATGRINASVSDVASAVASASFTVRSTSSFDNRGRTVSSTRDGISTTTAYTEEDNLQKVTSTYADGSVTQQYSEGPFSIKSISPSGVETVYIYDDAGNRVKVTEAGNVKQTSEYDKFKRLVSQADALGNTTKYNYNLNNQVAEITFADGSKQYRGYNKLGQLVSQSGANTYPLSFSYNANNQMASMTDGNGAVTKWIYNEYGQLMKKLYDGSTTTNPDLSYEYDLKGKMISRTDKRGVMTRYWYDNVGQQRGVDYPHFDNVTQVASGEQYSSLSEFLNEKRFGEDMRYSYDEFNRVSKIECLAGETTFNYDGASSRLITESNAHATLNYQYTNGMLSKLTAGSDYSVDYNYVSGRLNSVTTNVNGQSSTTNFAYKQNSELLDKQTTLSGTNTVERSYTFDAADRLLSINNKSNSDVVSNFTYVLDKLGRRSSIAKTGTAYANSESISYRYNSKGELINANSSLTTGDNFRYNYDEIGNRLLYQKNDYKINGTYNKLNQIQELMYRGKMPFKGDITAKNGTLATVNANGDSVTTDDNAKLEFEGSVKIVDGKKLIVLAEDSTGKRSSVVKEIPDQNGYTYDANGNLKNDGDDDYFRPGNADYYWQCENRLRKILRNKTRIYFFYDYMGRKIDTKIYTLVSGSGNWVLTKHKKFVYHNYKLILELDLLANTSKKFVWLGDNLLSFHEGTNSYQYVADGNKNITQLISSTTGAIINKYEYNPFGALAVNNETVDNPFKFSSEYNEKETGLVYYNYRFYDPSNGKWLSRDPIQEKGGFNLYHFIYNNPISYIDKLGLLAHIDPNPTSCVSCHSYNPGKVSPKIHPDDEQYRYDEPSVWGFMSHYFGGNGLTWDTSYASNFMNGFKKRIKHDIRGLKLKILSSALNCKNKENDLSLNGIKERVFEISSSARLPLSPFFNGDMYQVLNQGMIKVEYVCNGNLSCQCCDDKKLHPKNFKIQCSLKFSISDKFTNPLDIGGMYKEGNDFGTKYKIRASWQDSISVDKKYSCKK